MISPQANGEFVFDIELALVYTLHNTHCTIVISSSEKLGLLPRLALKLYYLDTWYKSYMGPSRTAHVVLSYTISTKHSVLIATSHIDIPRTTDTVILLSTSVNSPQK